MNPLVSRAGLPAAAVVAFAAPAFAAESKIDPADTAFMIAATALVLLMTIPGLALFYGGMVRRKNVLATMSQSVAATAVVSLLWFALAYSLAFRGDGALIGGFDRTFLAGIGVESTSPFAKTIPEMLFMAYQMTFAVITCALVGGAVADRLRFSAFLAFCALWLFIVYAPIAHWVWGGGFLARLGLIDFAGGTVVHINAGVAGLVAALDGRRPAGLWARESRAVQPRTRRDRRRPVVGRLVRLQRRLGAGGRIARRLRHRRHASFGLHRRASVVRIRMGLARQALGARTDLRRDRRARRDHARLGLCPALARRRHRRAGRRLCYWACTALKQRLGYDDSLDVFGVHGVGGALGTLLAGVFATASLSAAGGEPGISGLLEGNPSQLLAQAIGVGATVLWCAIGTWITLKIVDALVGLRVGADQEREGLDVALHGEALGL